MLDDPLVALALRLTDGESIDWKAETQNASLDPSLLQKLQQIEAVARAHGIDNTPDTGDHIIPAGIVPGMPGANWGCLEIIELIGSGSYGDVYRARDTRLGRDVALKLLRTRDAIQSDSTSLIREGHLLSRVRHANVVTVHGADCLNGQTGLWMELIEGETLEQEVRRRGALAAAEVAQIGAVLSDALEAVHSAGLLHRDVKAQNVMRDRAERLVLMDFGSGHDAQRFAASTVEGTPLYAAPEVLNGGEASVRSDIYSLGVLLWYLLTASYPVNGRSVDEIKRAHALGRIAKQEDFGAVGAVARIAAECLAIDPRKRPPAAGEVGSRLRECSQPSGLRRRFIRNWSGLSVFAAAVLVLSTAPLHFSSKAHARDLGATDEPIWSAEAGVVASGAPSADGHYFACHSREIPLAVCNVTTGTMQRVPLIERIEDGWGARPLISPEGQRVAYQGLAHEEVKIFDLSISTSKSLRVDPSLRLRIIEWRASGDSLLVVLSPFFGRPPDEEPHYLSSVALLDTSTGTLTNLKQFDETPGGVALSHDGSHLAFTQRGDLFISDLLSGDTRHIAGASDFHGSFLWMPNDDGLLAGGKNLSELQLMRLADGLRVAEIEVLRPKGGSSVALLGMSVTGDVYYNAYTEPALYIAPIDTATQQVGPPAAIAMMRSSNGMDWSPDSRSIAYARWDETKTLPTIVIRNVGTSVEREIELPDDSPNHRFTGGVRVIRWSMQGDILATANSYNYLVHPDETSVKRIGSETPAAFSVEWAPDGSSLLSAGRGFVRRFDVVTGDPTESYSLPEISGVQLLPQQELVAFSNVRNGKFEISVLALGNSVPRILLVSDRLCRPVGWWNREVFLACRDDSEASHLSPLYLLDIVSGAMKTLDVSLRGIAHVRVRPDDRAIAIVGETTFNNSTFILKVPRRYSQKAHTPDTPQR